MRTTRARVLALLLCGALGATGLAGDEPAAALKALEQRYEQAEGSYPDKFAAVKADYEAFAEANAGTEEALTALLFLLRNTWWEREAGTMSASAGRLVERILDGYAASPRLALLIETKYVLSAEQRTSVFGKLLEESPHDGVRAEALLALATGQKRADPEAAKARFAELLARFGTVERRGVIPYSEYAQAHLSPHAPADLAIGATAPEIGGRDLDGNPLRLSDLRGKVVVLDFWGDW